MQQQIDTIVFDMGQVLIHWQPLALIAHMNLTEKQQELLLTELFQSVEWVQSDHGTIALEQIVTQVCRRLPEDLHPAVEELVLGWWRRPLVPWWLRGRRAASALPKQTQTAARRPAWT